MKIAVVGGGWSGLAAAVDLVGGGATVTLFEAGRTLGGRARASVVDQRRLDNGQHILLGAYSETLAVMRAVGADPERLLTRQPLNVTLPGRFHLTLPRWPAPLNLAWAMLTARGTPWRDKLQTSLWMLALRARRFRVPADTSVAAWLDAAGQHGPLRKYLWEPLCLAALNCPAERASAQIFANVLRDSLGSPKRQDTDLLLPRTDLGAVLPEPANAWLTQQGATLRCGHRVAKIDCASPAEIVVDGMPFDAVIIATAPQHAASLCPDPLPAFEFEPIATVYLQYPKNIRLPYPLLQQPGPLGQWVVDRGNGLLASVLSGHGHWETLSDDALSAALQQELGIATAPIWTKTIREKRATFACRPGLMRPAWQTKHPRLFLAGDYTWTDYPATLEGAVRSGRRAARAALGKSFRLIS